jgi:hypothetical protein
MLCRACKELADGEANKGDISGTDKDDFIPLESIKGQVDLLNQGEPVTEPELLDICDTEGNHLNGGGSFDVRRDDSGKVAIRWVSGNSAGDQPLLQRAVGAPGEIGSPIVGSGPFPR